MVTYSVCHLRSDRNKNVKFFLYPSSGRDLRKKPKFLLNEGNYGWRESGLTNPKWHRTRRFATVISCQVTFSFFFFFMLNCFISNKFFWYLFQVVRHIFTIRKKSIGLQALIYLWKNWNLWKITSIYKIQ